VNIKTREAIILILLCATALATAGYALLQAQRRIVATVTIKTVGVGVYHDASATLPVTEINWGVKEPGSVSTYPMYIKNEGTSDVVLSLATEEWNPPEAVNYITLGWTYDSSALTPNQIIQVDFVLTIDSNITGITTFTFTIVVIATSTS